MGNLYNYKLTIAYRGTRYCGWQVQPNGISVCGAFQDAVEKTLGGRYDVKGCSRTDAGVHANGFVLSLRCDISLPPEGLLRGLNSVLPQDIAVKSCESAAEDFHPRYDCCGKRYIYKIRNSVIPDPFGADLALLYPRPLDERLMDAAAGRFVGRHDFSAFCASGGAIPPGERERSIAAAGVTRYGEELVFSIEGDGFLYNMVRIMAGTLLEVSAGKISPDDIDAMIASRDRSRAGATAPAQGLYLDRVFY